MSVNGRLSAAAFRMSVTSSGVSQEVTGAPAKSMLSQPSPSTRVVGVLSMPRTDDVEVIQFLVPKGARARLKKWAAMRRLELSDMLREAVENHTAIPLRVARRGTYDRLVRPPQDAPDEGAD